MFCRIQLGFKPFFRLFDIEFRFLSRGDKSIFLFSIANFGWGSGWQQKGEDTFSIVVRRVYTIEEHAAPISWPIISLRSCQPRQPLQSTRTHRDGEYSFTWIPYIGLDCHPVLKGTGKVSASRRTKGNPLFLHLQKPSLCGVDEAKDETRYITTLSSYGAQNTHPSSIFQ